MSPPINVVIVSNCSPANSVWIGMFAERYVKVPIPLCLLWLARIARRPSHRTLRSADTWRKTFVVGSRTMSNPKKRWSVRDAKRPSPPTTRSVGTFERIYASIRVPLLRPRRLRLRRPRLLRHRRPRLLRHRRSRLLRHRRSRLLLPRHRSRTRAASRGTTA